MDFITDLVQKFENINTLKNDITVYNYLILPNNFKLLTLINNYMEQYMFNNS